MRMIKLLDGSELPVLGMGTWELGENTSIWEQEVEALKLGVEEGLTLIDTAEMYGRGSSEELIGEAIRGVMRESLYLVSKVLPSNAGGDRLEAALDATLKRLGTDYLDMYLYHWRGHYPLQETVDRLEEMVKKGKIRRWGVSNFDKEDMEELLSIPGGKHCCVNQVLYHLGSRGIEYDLLPYLRQNGIPVMAYCPLAQGGALRNRLLSNEILKQVANKYGVNVIQLLLMFVLHQDNICAIPRSGNPEHIKQIVEVMNMMLLEEDYTIISNEFPAPDHKTALDKV